MAKPTGKKLPLFHMEYMAGLRQVNPAFFDMTVLSIFALLISVIGITFDQRLIAGELAWIKPLKFSLSIALYGGSLLLVSRNLKFSSALKRASCLAYAAGTIELAAIFVQVLQGVSSNFDTANAFDSAIWLLSKIAILPLASASIVMLLLLLRQDRLPSVLGSAICWGLFLAIVGFIPGFIMLLPEHIQHSYSHVTVLNAAPHHLSSMRFPGWNTVAGDLRVAHFFGLHALQIMPLLAFCLNRFSWLPLIRKQILVTISGCSYFSILFLLTWQALHGESVFAASPHSQASFALVFILTVLSCAIAILPIKYSQLALLIFRRKNQASA